MSNLLKIQFILLKIRELTNVKTRQFLPSILYSLSLSTHSLVLPKWLLQRDYCAADKNGRRIFLEMSILFLPDCIAMVYLFWVIHTYFTSKNPNRNNRRCNYVVFLVWCTDPFENLLNCQFPCWGGGDGRGGHIYVYIHIIL